MQVRLITVVETLIDVSKHNPTYEEAKGEILGSLTGIAEDEAVTEEIKDAHHAAVRFDTVISQNVTHSFEEVKP